MKKLEEIDSLGILLENKVDFQRLIDNILEDLIETFHNKWNNMFSSFNLDIDDPKLFPCIVSFDIVDGFQAGIQFIQPLYYTLDKEFDFLIPDIISIDEFVKVSKTTTPGKYILNKIIDPEVMKKQKQLPSTEIRQSGQLIKNKDVCFWSLMDKKDILPTLIKLESGVLININQIASINKNQVRMVDGSFYDLTKNELEALYSLYNFGNSTIEFDCISVSKLGTIIGLNNKEERD